MWVVVACEPRPDAAYWPGRRWLAAVDAAIWPAAWIVVIRHLPGQTGLIGPFATAVAGVCAVERLYRALWANHRYWLTTWRWGRVFAVLIVLGEAMKMATA